MAQLPADRTKLSAAQSNQVPGTDAASAKNIAAITEAYDTLDKLNNKVNGNNSNINDRLTKELAARDKRIDYMIENAGDNTQVVDLKFTLGRDRIEYVDLEYKGYNFLSYLNTGYYDNSKVIEAKNTGANTLAIVPIRHMETGTSTTIPNIVITNEAVIQAIQNAKAAGLKVVLKPHVDVDDGTFRGDISPTNWDAWFTSYQAYIVEMATISQTYGVDLLFIGTELKSATAIGNASRWQTIVSAVRAVYTGKLSYCALASQSFLGYESDEFGVIDHIWNLVDYGGISMYFRMANIDEPTVDDLNAAWTFNRDGRNIIEMLYRWHLRIGKPIVFGECGCSRTYAATKDLNQTRDNGYTPLSDTEQPRYLESLINTWSSVGDWFKGMFLWNFHTDSSSLYTINGYPGEEVVTELYSRKALDVVGQEVLSSPSKVLSYNAKVGVRTLAEYLIEPKFRAQQTSDAAQAGSWWTKLGEIVLTKQLSAAESLLSIMNGDHPASSPTYNMRGLLWVRAKQQDTLGGAPIVQMTLLSASGLSATDLVAVNTIVNSTKSKVELYVKNRLSFDTIVFKELHGECLYDQKWIWSANPAIASLPSGTQTFATMQDGNFGSISATSATVNGSSVLTKTSYSSFSYVYASASASLALGVATFTKMPYNTVSSDQLSEWSATNREFTCNEPGLYQIVAKLRFDSQTSGSISAIQIGVNRSGTVTYPENIVRTSSDNGVMMLQITALIRLLNVGDKVWAEGYNSLGATTSTNNCTITIARVQ